MAFHPSFNHPWQYFITSCRQEKIGFWPMDEIIYHPWQYLFTYHKKCHLKTYHSYIKYHMTVNITFNVLMFFGYKMILLVKSYNSNWQPTLIRQNSVAVIRVLKHAISTRRLANSSWGCSHFSCKFQSSFEYFRSLSMWRFSCSLNGHRGLPTMLTIEPRMIIIFGAPSSISFKHLSFWIPFLEPHLTTSHSNICVQLREVTKLGMSTLDLQPPQIHTMTSHKDMKHAISTR